MGKLLQALSTKLEKVREERRTPPPDYRADRKKALEYIKRQNDLQFIETALGLKAVGAIQRLPKEKQDEFYEKCIQGENRKYFTKEFYSQRLDPKLSVLHRLLIGYAVTDELFGIAVAQPKPLDPTYSYGSYTVAIPMWAIGTALGVIAGNILPLRVVSALSVALFGMFIAVIIPPAKGNRVVLLFVALSFAASFAASRLPLISGLSDSARVIILTLVLSAAAAAAFPLKSEETEAAE